MFSKTLRFLANHKFQEILYIKAVDLAQWLGHPRRSKQNHAFNPKSTAGKGQGCHAFDPQSTARKG
jgi:hypothetical protein